MYLLNNGTLKVNEASVEKLISKLLEKGVVNSRNLLDITAWSADDCDVDFTHSYGDIESDLKELVDELKEEGIIVNGHIVYDGDFSGVYDIVDGELSCYSSDEWVVKEALEYQEIIGQPLAEKILAKIKEIQIIPGLPVDANIALEEIAKLVKKEN